jgi:L-threonylcarbamoyladenylate synthase
VGGFLHIAAAVRALRAGGIIAYPTEGVWGLGCDPFNESAVRRLLALKGRPVSKGLILVAGDAAQFDSCLRGLPRATRERICRSWPGPVTWVVPAAPQLPQWIRGDHPGAAIRVSAHPLVRALSEAFAGPIVSTSANPQGLAPARTELKVRLYFRDRVDYVLSGELGGARGASEIRDAMTGRVLRPA